MEIERKYLIDEKNLPADLESCRSVLIEQGYLCRKPVVRIRRQDDDYILTYKSGRPEAREKYNLPLGAEGLCPSERKNRRQTDLQETLSDPYGEWSYHRTGCIL